MKHGVRTYVCDSVVLNESKQDTHKKTTSWHFHTVGQKSMTGRGSHEHKCRDHMAVMYVYSRIGNGTFAGLVFATLSEYSYMQYVQDITSTPTFTTDQFEFEIQL